MDKRTLFFVISLSIVLFGVNFFFERRHTEQIKEWEGQQKVQKQQELQQLTKEIEENTVSSSDLPLVLLFKTSAQDNPIAKGVLSNGAIITLAWNKNIPDQVYASSTSQTKPTRYKLVSRPSKVGMPAIYLSKANEQLSVPALPFFGSFPLQMVPVIPNEDGSFPGIILAEYRDGNFSIPQRKVEQLNEELDEKLSKRIIKPLENAIVLKKEGDSFLPVAVYYLGLDDFIKLETLEDLTPLLSKTDAEDYEKYYVLENQYQQLVFSNYGGALAEINLPFKSKENPESVVREIEFDKLMVKNHPYNAHFPAHAYYTPGENPEEPFVKHQEGELGGYYPLLRRDLIQTGDYPSIRVSPKYYALNIVSEYPEVAKLIYEVKYFDSKKIVFEATQKYRKITKTFTLNDEAAPYCFNLDVNIEGDSQGLWLTTGVPEVEWISGGPASSLKYRSTRKGKPEVKQIDLPKDAISVTTITPDWVSNSNGFLGMILDPLTPIDQGYRAQYVSGTTVPSRLIEIDEEYDRFSLEKMPGYMLMMPLAQKVEEMHFRFFAGPYSDGILKSVDAHYSKNGYNPDYIASQTFHGWFAFISEPFAKFLFILMNFFHSITGSWAFSIILLTVALKIMLYPLNAWSTKSMLKMQAIAPEVAAIQERYKKDPKKIQLEIMNLYREKGVNPVSGCFPILIQIPFLIGMFDLLKSTFELRGAPFIPGWIDNLTAPDVLFSWGRPIFFIGNEFHLLPLLLGFVMFLQQRISSPLPKDQSQWTDQQRQQRATGTIMAVVFTIMFYNFPSGLNIYWLSSMLLGILQQWWISKRMNLPLKTKNSVPSQARIK